MQISLKFIIKGSIVDRLVSIGSGNGLLPVTDGKPLHEAMLTKTSDNIWHQNELTHCGLVTQYGDIDLCQ